MSEPRRCPVTGQTLPECSCTACLEEQLERFAPHILTAELRSAPPAEALGEHLAAPPHA